MVTETIYCKRNETATSCSRQSLVIYMPWKSSSITLTKSYRGLSKEIKSKFLSTAILASLSAHRLAWRNFFTSIHCACLANSCVVAMFSFRPMWDKCQKRWQFDIIYWENQSRGGSIINIAPTFYLFIKFLNGKRQLHGLHSMH